MIRRHAISTARRAFTLVELMVTITIVLIMMSILATASSIAADAFRGAKVQGDFVAQERAALAVLRRDLQFPHFLEEDGKPNLGRRLSDQRLDKLTVSGTTLTGYKPPKSGYFYAESTKVDNVWNFDELSDGDGFQSSRSGNHVLQFTIIVPGGAPEDTLIADVPFQTTSPPVVGRTAEVAYFLVANGTTPGGVNKYKLIRRQRLAAFNDDDKPAYSGLVAPIALTDASEVMTAYRDPPTSPPNRVSHLNDLTLAKHRLGGSLAPARGAITGNRIGEDVLLTNVTSFEVKFTGTTGTTGTPAGFTWPAPFTTNSDYPYDNLPLDGKFDTFHQAAGWDTVTAVASNLANATNTTRALKKIRITGVSIRLRCWNPNSKSSRQTTIIVDL